MGCGCGGSKRPAVAATSGDYEPAPGMSRFKVVSDVIDPDTGEPVEDEFTTYRAARLAQVANGGKLRAVRPT